MYVVLKVQILSHGPVAQLVRAPPVTAEVEKFEDSSGSLAFYKLTVLVRKCTVWGL